MKFFFMEMNTRLQVEHPVTEAITGLDLVEWQLRVASGEPLPLQAGRTAHPRPCHRGAHLRREPRQQFPARHRHPACVPQAGVHQRSSVGPTRVDDGVREGDAISPFYDSMIAKLIVHGDTREQALARLDEALAQTHIVGLATNVQFLRHVVRSPSFAQANLDTALIPREKPCSSGKNPWACPWPQRPPWPRPSCKSRRWPWTTHWAAATAGARMASTTRRFAFEFHGEPARADLACLHDGSLMLSVGGASGLLEYTQAGDALDIRFAGQRRTARVYANGETDHVFTPQGATQILAIDLLAHAGEGQADAGRLTAPMPGKVVSFAVKAGDKVSKGQALAVMEAMKMEHTIAAPIDGVVAELLYAPGDQVAEGAELLKLATPQ